MHLSSRAAKQNTIMDQAVDMVSQPIRYECRAKRSVDHKRRQTTVPKGKSMMTQS